MLCVSGAHFFPDTFLASRCRVPVAIESRLLRPLLAIYLRGFVRVTDKRSARLVLGLFIFTYFLIFVALGLAPVPEHSARILRQSGVGGLIGFLASLASASGVLAFLAPWVAVGSELRYNQTLNILRNLKVPTREAVPPLFLLSYALPLLFCSYLAVVFFLYLSSLAQLPLMHRTILSLAFLFYLLAISGVGFALSTYLSDVAQSRWGITIAGGAWAIVGVVVLVTYLRFPEWIEDLVGGVWDGAGEALSLTLRSIPSALPVLLVGAAAATVTNGVAYCAFVRGHGRAAAKGVPEERLRPALSFAPWLARRGGREFTMLLLKDSMLLARRASELVSPLGAAMVFALLPPGASLIARVPRAGSGLLFLVELYFVGLALYLVALACAAVFLLEGRCLQFYRPAGRIWHKAMIAKTTLIGVGGALATGPSAAIYLPLAGDFGGSFLSYYIFLVISAALAAAAAAMWFGDYASDAPRMSTVGQAMYLTAALVVVVGAVASAGVGIIAGTAAVLLSCVLGLLVLGILLSLWVRSSRALATADL